MPAAKGSKRTRTAAAEVQQPPSTRSTSAASPPAAPPSSSNLAPGARPMSAVAARRAAREAAAAAATQPPARAEPKPSSSSSSSAAAAKSPDVDMRQRSPSPTSTPLQGSSDDEEEPEIVVPRKKAKVAASRYFASGGEEAGSSSSSSSLPKARTAASRAPSEDYTPLAEEEEEAGDVSAEWGTPRANRRRREKPSFIDSSCVSSLVPSPGENVVECQARIDGQDKLATLFFLQADETILLRGVCGITPVWGAVSVLNATLRAAAAADPASPLDLADLPEDALHPLFVPNSHAVPPIRALRSPTRPPPLRTVDGRTLATPSGCAAIVLVSDLDTQVEGLERILAAGGIGHGLGFSTRKGKMPVSDVSGRTWSLLVTPEPSYTCLREDEQWQMALQSHLPPSPFASTSSSDTDWRGDAFVAMVEGPKRVGKSTFAKLLLNELLDRYEAVAYLDTDLGQAEFTAPGFVSLTVLRRPVLGPSFTHLHESFESHFFGSTSPASDPTDYLTACEALLATYRLEVEFAGGDDSASAVGPGRRQRSRAAGPDQNGPSKCRERVPLVVNTSGWIKGLGADILSRLKDLARPTHVFTFADPATETSSFAVQDFSPQPFPPAVPYRQIPLPAAFASPLESKWTPADLRTLALASYFYSQGCIGGGQVPRWDTTRPLIAQPVRTCSWGSSPSPLKASAVYMAGTGDIRYEHVLHALNGSIVALVADSQLARDPSRPFPYAPRAPLPSPASSRAVGLAIVHSFAPAAESMYLLTPTAPTSSGSSALALVKGALDTPVALMCDFTARADESDAGLAGVDWEDVPYLSVETGEAVGRRRVRRNLMRKGQA